MSLSLEAEYSYRKLGGQPVEASMERDIDIIRDRLTATIPGVQIVQLKVNHPGADDDGLWFINIRDRIEQVQIESSNGKCPFLIESDFNNERLHGLTVDEVVDGCGGT